MWLIVGLGNPGKEYALTRHNIGFRCVDALAGKAGIAFRRRSRAAVGRGEIAGVPVVLAKPSTYMNLSGEAVPGLLQAHRIRLEDLVIIYDDIDLPLGTIRIRARGSSGGHRGLQSIIERLGSDQLVRVRVGIGRPEEGGREAVGHVLSRFSPEEERVVREVVERVVQAVEVMLTHGVTKAMNEFNA